MESGMMAPGLDGLLSDKSTDYTRIKVIALLI